MYRITKPGWRIPTSFSTRVRVPHKHCNLVLRHPFQNRVKGRLAIMVSKQAEKNHRNGCQHNSPKREQYDTRFHLCALIL